MPQGLRSPDESLSKSYQHRRHQKCNCRKCHSHRSHRKHRGLVCHPQCCKHYLRHHLKCRGHRPIPTTNQQENPGAGGLRIWNDGAAAVRKGSTTVSTEPWRRRRFYHTGGRIYGHWAMRFPSNNNPHHHLRAGCSSPSLISDEYEFEQDFGTNAYGHISTESKQNHGLSRY